MDEGQRRHWIEIGVDAAAAAALAASLALAAVKLAGSGPGAALAALAGFAAAFAGLRRVPPEPPTFAVSPFEPVTVQSESFDPPELLLTADMAVQQPAEVDELVLDDVLASLSPDSRVVRLFQPVELPTAGELQATIDRHLRAGGKLNTPPDATHALHDALAELRRSLR
ncbi:MAG TPA: hypothetical protein VM346_09855 [Sphingomicrobium sp.]|nr:hypothetical protein [Sphingomicrobium sp.]